jgi:hypothetical protein
LTPQEYRTALDRLALSQRAAARFFGVDERTSRAWADTRGKGGPPEAVAMWLRYMLATGMTPADIVLKITNEAHTTTA